MGALVDLVIISLRVLKKLAVRIASERKRLLDFADLEGVSMDRVGFQATLGLQSLSLH